MQCFPKKKRKNSFKITSPTKHKNGLELKSHQIKFQFHAIFPSILFIKHVMFQSTSYTFHIQNSQGAFVHYLNSSDFCVAYGCLCHANRRCCVLHLYVLFIQHTTYTNTLTHSCIHSHIHTHITCHCCVTNEEELQ